MISRTRKEKANATSSQLQALQPRTGTPRDTRGGCSLILEVKILNVLVNNYESYTSVILQFILTQSVIITLPKIQSSNSKNVIKKFDYLQKIKKSKILSQNNYPI